MFNELAALSFVVICATMRLGIPVLSAVVVTTSSKYPKFKITTDLIKINIGSKLPACV